MHTESVLDFKLATVLSDRGIIPGVCANGELAPIPRSEHEFIVQGLDDLLPKLQAARAAGARFSKWRAPIACTSADGGYPTRLSLETQAETLAQFAAISQQAGLVPIVEPDVEFVEFAKDADLARSAEIHEKAIDMIYARMKVHGVLLEGEVGNGCWNLVSNRQKHTQVHSLNLRFPSQGWNTRPGQMLLQKRSHLLQQLFCRTRFLRQCQEYCFFLVSIFLLSPVLYECS